MKSRLDVELTPQASRDVWLATQILMGLRYSDEMVEGLVRGAYHMEESTTYQAIITKGRVLEAREVLLRRGRKKLGEPDSSAAATLYSIGDYARLEALMDRLLDESVSSWSELLDPSFPS